MGMTYTAICRDCGTRFDVNEGSGMSAMPLRCDRCGRQWWWEFGDGGPAGDPEPPRCECGGTFDEEAPPRCPKCRSTNLKRDPDGIQIRYD